MCNIQTSKMRISNSPPISTPTMKKVDSGIIEKKLQPEAYLFNNKNIKQNEIKPGLVQSLLVKMNDDQSSEINKNENTKSTTTAIPSEIKDNASLISNATPVDDVTNEPESNFGKKPLNAGFSMFAAQMIRRRINNDFAKPTEEINRVQEEVKIVLEYEKLNKPLPEINANSEKPLNKIHSLINTFNHNGISNSIRVPSRIDSMVCIKKNIDDVQTENEKSENAIKIKPGSNNFQDTDIAIYNNKFPLEKNLDTGFTHLDDAVYDLSQNNKCHTTDIIEDAASIVSEPITKLQSIKATDKIIVKYSSEDSNSDIDLYSSNSSDHDNLKEKILFLSLDDKTQSNNNKKKNTILRSTYVKSATDHLNTSNFPKSTVLDNKKDIGNIETIIPEISVSVSSTEMDVEHVVNCKSEELVTNNGHRSNEKNKNAQLEESYQVKSNEKSEASHFSNSDESAVKKDIQLKTHRKKKRILESKRKASKYKEPKKKHTELNLREILENTSSRIENLKTNAENNSKPLTKQLKIENETPLTTNNISYNRQALIKSTLEKGKSLECSNKSIVREIVDEVHQSLHKNSRPTLIYDNNKIQTNKLKDQPKKLESISKTELDEICTRDIATILVNDNCSSNRLVSEIIHKVKGNNRSRKNSNVETSSRTTSSSKSYTGSFRDIGNVLKRSLMIKSNNSNSSTKIATIEQNSVHVVNNYNDHVKSQLVEIISNDVNSTSKFGNTSNSTGVSPTYTEAPPLPPKDIKVHKTMPIITDFSDVIAKPNLSLEDKFIPEIQDMIRLTTESQYRISHRSSVELDSDYYHMRKQINSSKVSFASNSNESMRTPKERKRNKNTLKIKTSKLKTKSRHRSTSEDKKKLYSKETKASRKTRKAVKNSSLEDAEDVTKVSNDFKVEHPDKKKSLPKFVDRDAMIKLSKIRKLSFSSDSDTLTEPKRSNQPHEIFPDNVSNYCSYLHPIPIQPLQGSHSLPLFGQYLPNYFVPNPLLATGYRSTPSFQGQIYQDSITNPGRILTFSERNTKLVDESSSSSENSIGNKIKHGEKKLKNNYVGRTPKRYRKRHFKKSRRNSSSTDISPIESLSGLYDSSTTSTFNGIEAEDKKLLKKSFSDSLISTVDCTAISENAAISQISLCHSLRMVRQMANSNISVSKTLVELVEAYRKLKKLNGSLKKSDGKRVKQLQDKIYYLLEKIEELSKKVNNEEKIQRRLILQNRRLSTLFDSNPVNRENLTQLKNPETDRAFLQRTNSLENNSQRKIENTLPSFDALVCVKSNHKEATPEDLNFDPYENYQSEKVISKEPLIHSDNDIMRIIRNNKDTLLKLLQINPETIKSEDYVANIAVVQNENSDVEIGEHVHNKINQPKFEQGNQETGDKDGFNVESSSPTSSIKLAKNAQCEDIKVNIKLPGARCLTRKKAKKWPKMWLFRRMSSSKPELPIGDILKPGMHYSHYYQELEDTELQISKENGVQVANGIYQKLTDGERIINQNCMKDNNPHLSNEQIGKEQVDNQSENKYIIASPIGSKIAALKQVSSFNENKVTEQNIPETKSDSLNELERAVANQELKLLAAIEYERDFLKAPLNVNICSPPVSPPHTPEPLAGVKEITDDLVAKNLIEHLKKEVRLVFENEKLQLEALRLNENYKILELRNNLELQQEKLISQKKDLEHEYQQKLNGLENLKAELVRRRESIEKHGKENEEKSRNQTKDFKLFGNDSIMINKIKQEREQLETLRLSLVQKDILIEELRQSRYSQHIREIGQYQKLLELRQLKYESGFKKDIKCKDVRYSPMDSPPSEPYISDIFPVKSNRPGKEFLPQFNWAYDKRPETQMEENSYLLNTDILVDADKEELNNFQEEVILYDEKDGFSFENIKDFNSNIVSRPSIKPDFIELDLPNSPIQPIEDIVITEDKASTPIKEFQNKSFLNILNNIDNVVSKSSTDKKHKKHHHSDKNKVKNKKRKKLHQNEVIQINEDNILDGKDDILLVAIDNDVKIRKSIEKIDNKNQNLEKNENVNNFEKNLKKEIISLSQPAGIEKTAVTELLLPENTININVVDQVIDTDPIDLEPIYNEQFILGKLTIDTSTMKETVDHNNLIKTPASNLISFGERAVEGKNDSNIPLRVEIPKVDLCDYVFGKTIERGSMGKVKIVTNVHSNKKYACKIIPHSKITHLVLENISGLTIGGKTILLGPTDSISELQSFQTQVEKTADLLKHKLVDNFEEDEIFSEKQWTLDKQQRGRIIREISLLFVANHPYIVTLNEIIITTDANYLIMELVEGGQLLDKIVCEGQMTEVLARQYMREIATTVDYCHSSNIVHRDLKIENILLDKQTGSIKLIDFGLSNVYSDDKLLDTFCGSLYFAAPELLNAQKYIGPEIDIWSMGVIMYILVTGKVPFDDSSMIKLHQKIKNGEIKYPSYLSTDCIDLLSRMLNVDPMCRIKLDKIKEHPWLTPNNTLALVSYSKFQVIDILEIYEDAYDKYIAEQEELSDDETATKRIEYTHMDPLEKEIRFTLEIIKNLALFQLDSEQNLKLILFYDYLQQSARDKAPLNIDKNSISNDNFANTVFSLYILIRNDYKRRSEDRDLIKRRKSIKERRDKLIMIQRSIEFEKFMNMKDEEERNKTIESQLMKNYDIKSYPVVVGDGKPVSPSTIQLFPSTNEAATGGIRTATSNISVSTGFFGRSKRNRQKIPQPLGSSASAPPICDKTTSSLPVDTRKWPTLFPQRNPDLR